MYNDVQSPSCGCTEMANVNVRRELQEESPRVPEIHLIFGNLRNKLDSINSRLESIVTVLRGDSCDRKQSPVKEVECLPHQMGLCSNFQSLEMRIDEASEEIENLYSILGMEKGKIY